MLARIILTLTLVLPIEPGTEESRPAAKQAVDAALRAFTPPSQTLIERASPDFVKTKDGTLWDRQLQLRRDKLEAKLRDSKQPIPNDERDAVPLGLAKNAENIRVPLWFTTQRRCGGEWPDGCACTTQGEIDLERLTTPEGMRFTDQLVCERIIDENTAIARLVRNNSDARFAALQARQRTGRSVPEDPPAWIETTLRYRVVGYRFQHDGQKLTDIWVKSGDAWKDSSGNTFPTMIITDLNGPMDTTESVSAEELATAIRDGNVKLSKWRWLRRNGKLQWIREDVRLTLSEPTASPATPSTSPR